MGRRTTGVRLRKRGKYYEASFTVAGKRHFVSTGKSRASEAKAVAAEAYRQAHLRTEAPEQAAPGSTPLAEEAAEWLASMRATRAKSTVDVYSDYVRAHWLTRWETVQQLAEPGEVQDYITDGCLERKPGSIRKELSALRGFMRWAIERRLITAMPKFVAPKGHSDYRAPLFTRAEVFAVIAEVRRPEVRAYLRFAWETAFRRSTLARLRWDDVDFAAGVIRVRSSADKTRDARLVPLTAAAAAALRELRSDRRGLIFPHARQGHRDALMAACERLGCQRLTPHLIRHSRLTHLVERTQNLAGVQAIAGHKHLSTTARYVHPRLEAALAALADAGEM